VTILHRHRGAAVLVSALLARSAAAGESSGTLVGWVENTKGSPVAGAIVSLFGKGLRGGSLVTLTDSAGQFQLAALPAGSYTLRALDSAHLPAPARRVTVLPDRDSLFTVSLTPVGELPSDSKDLAVQEAAVARELRWLLRHKRRSVLEERSEDDREEEASRAQAVPAAHLLETLPWLPEMAGTVEVMANPATLGVSTDSDWADTVRTSLGVLRLKGRLADTARWSVNGLVTESESTTWRMTADLVVEPSLGHRITAGTAYGTRFLRPLVPGEADARLDNRSVGAIFVEDRMPLGERLSATIGARYSYIGFLGQRNHLNPSAALEYRRDSWTRFRAAFTTGTLAPGGDLLTLSTLSSGPSVAFASMAHDLRPERSSRYELQVERAMGESTLTGHAVFEDVEDQLVNSFEGAGPPRSLRIVNGGSVAAWSTGFTLARRFGDSTRGSVTYMYGHTWRNNRPPGIVLADRSAAGMLEYGDAGFHDVVARLETVIDWSDTRVSAYCRLNTLNPEGDGPVGKTTTNTRFDIQLSQGLPFLRPLTRAEWEVLVAVRNLFYETSEGATLDEVVVSHPPKRVLGGISVKF
jgi:hypothetical protein